MKKETSSVVSTYAHNSSATLTLAAVLIQLYEIDSLLLSYLIKYTSIILRFNRTYILYSYVRNNEKKRERVTRNDACV